MGARVNNGLGALRNAILSLPVPGAPPRLSMDSAAIGLGFLDAALRLNHVRRLTERLSLVRHRDARRRVEVDVSLPMLSDIQREASQLFQRSISNRDDRPADDTDAEETVWVPIDRVSRRNDAPIDVVDASGSRIPRLTQAETTRLVASGLYRLLRAILASHSHSREGGTQLNRLLYGSQEPLWLVQSALLSIVAERGSPPPLPADSPETAGMELRECTAHIFQRYEPFLSSYYKLLDVAVNDYLVVVGLNARSEEHLLSYEVPMPIAGRDRWPARSWRLARANYKGYYVNYQTDVPSTLRSYHLVVETEPGVDVDGLFLTTDADELATKQLAANLASIAERLEKGEPKPNTATDSTKQRLMDKAFELELGSSLDKLSELVRRRTSEATRAEIRPRESSLSSCRSLALAARQNSRGHASTTNTHSPAGSTVAADTIRSAIREIEDLELVRDISAGPQPPSSRSHVYWKSPGADLTNTKRVRIHSGMVFRHTAESSFRLVALYAIAVAFASYAFAWFLTGSFFPYGPAGGRPKHGSAFNAGASIGVLLLIPGFLFSRLSTAKPHSITGYLSIVPRVVAYICIGAVGLLAVAVGAGDQGDLMRAIYGISTGVPLILFFAMVLPSILHRRTTRGRTFARLGAPRWATPENGRDLKKVTPNAKFISSGATDE